MDPRHLAQLSAILESGSISKASQVLHLTQPTLTHNMQALELRAGGQLFERSRFGVRSTALGEVLAREGRAIARSVRDAEETCALHRSGFRHTIRLGTGPLVGAALVPGLVAGLAAVVPGRAFSVQSDRPHLLVDQLVDGRHDLVIAPSWLDKPPAGIERFLLVRDTVGVYCGKGHPLAAAGVLAAGSDPEWLGMGVASPFDAPVREMLQEAGVATSRSEVTVMGDAHMVLEMLAKGRHLSVLPRYPLRFLAPFYGLVELVLPVVTPRARDIYLWCRTSLLEDASMLQVRDFILQHGQDGAGD
jgi:DNA-binding transcriptional LysR family regulator